MRGKGHCDSFLIRDFAEYIVSGLRCGFRVGFDHSRCRELRATGHNLGSAYEHQEVVLDYIANEREHGRVLGPLCPGSGQPIHTSSFGVIPKRHQYNKWRLIIDLSSPRGRSVNDGIDRSMSSLAYILVADVASAILSLGPGSLLAKSDVKHAYRQNPDDRPLLGMRWQGQLFCDATLPFGLRSAPLIFTAVVDALEWVLRSKGASNVFHYVDDFVFIGPPGTDKCRADLQLFKDTCSMLIAEDKTEGHGVETAGRQARSTQRRPPRVARQTRRFTPGLGISGGAIATRHPGGSP